MTTATHPAPARHAVGLGALWFGLFGAPVAWSIQELASFAVVSHSCYPSWQPLTVPSIAGAWTIALVIYLATLALGIAAAGTAWRAWRRTGEAQGESAPRQVEVGELEEASDDIGPMRRLGAAE